MRTPAPAIPARTADREDWRRVLHAASAVLGPLALRLPGGGGTIALAALAGLALVLEAARHTIPSVQRAVGGLARTVFRPGEERGISGATALAFGYLATWGLFDARSAAAAIVVGGLADPAAALVGCRWGRRRGGKSMAGSAACAGTAAVTLLACGYSAAPALMGGFVAAVAERAPWRGADNVLVPLAVGGALSILGLR